MTKRFDYRSTGIQSSEITPEHVFLNRRQFLKTLSIAGAGALLAACGVNPQAEPEGTSAPVEVEKSAPPAASQAVELDDPLTSYEQITNYNNYYEFTTDKKGVA
ncbi:MAG: twin-arginine translocation signal domain-containing protein, partial [Anaerolineales bacterium]|nr:twin-arginine translocation signal domain-containing protein [Anaerolineales bacterium]